MHDTCIIIIIIIIGSSGSSGSIGSIGSSGSSGSSGSIGSGSSGSGSSSSSSEAAGGGRVKSLDLGLVNGGVGGASEVSIWVSSTEELQAPVRYRISD